MIIATHGILASAAGFIPDADAQAFFDRVTTAGGSLSATEKTAVNQLVLDLKGYSIWTKMKAIYPMVGASSAACAQNLKSSSFTGTFNGGWTYANTGVTPNGSTGFMDTGLNPSSQLSIDNLSFTYYCRTNDARASYDCGVTTTTTGTNLSLNASLRWSDNTTYYSLLHNPTELSKSQTNSAKYFIFNKPSSTSVVLFENTTKTTSTVSNRSLVNVNFYLGARNLNGSASDYSNKQCALLTIGESFNDTEASNLYTAVNAFQVSLSRNV